MKIEVLKVYENLDGYIKEMEENSADINSLWEKYAIEPYWGKVCQYAPFDMSDRKPEPIKNIAKLKEQVNELKKLDTDKLVNKFTQIINVLPNYDDDPITIALYPIDDDNKVVREQQNGVWGACVFGNVLINVNPLVENYENWISYVFAHEYHHCVWGNYWMVINHGSTETLAEFMLGDGQADSFALSFNPSLQPKWLCQISDEDEKRLWNEHYRELVYNTGVDYNKYMFGDKKAGIPWCAGYFFGYRIMQSFLKAHKEYSVKQILEMDANKIFEMSNYQA